MSGIARLPRKGKRRIVFRVQYVAHRGKWKLSAPGFVMFYRRKADALVDGRFYARLNEPSQLMSYKKNGKFEIEWTYHNDPRRHKG